VGEQERVLLQRLDRQAQPLIERYKKRARNKKYYERVKIGMIELEKASSYAASAARHLTLFPLDDEHASKVDLILSATSALGRSLAEFVQKLEEASRETADLARTISVHTAVTTETKRGRPILNYVSETQALMRLYEEVTGKPVVFPKGSDKKGGAEQVSTEFIRQSLSQIDPKIRTANAITCIRNALKQNAELNRFLSEIMSDEK
jgi:hypothetical protein